MPKAGTHAPTADYLVAVASITATLVAIIGGFLVSRLVAMASERTGFTTRLHEAEDAARRAREALDEHDQQVEIAEVRLALRYLADLLISTSGNTSGDSLAQHLREKGQEYRVRPPVLAAALDKAATDTKAAFELFLELDAANNWPTHPPTALAAMKSRDIGLPRWLMENIYEEATRRREQRKRQAARESSPFSGLSQVLASVEGLGVPTRNYSSNAIMATLAQRGATSPYQPPKSRAALQDDVEARESELAIVRNALASVAPPPHFVPGLILLALYAAGSIVYPVTLLAVGQAELGPGWRYSVLGLFVAGLVGVFVYLAVLLLPRSDAATPVHAGASTDPRPSTGEPRPHAD